MPLPKNIYYNKKQLH